MRPPKRIRVAPTDDWPQLRPLLDWPEQVTYEVFRPVVLVGQSPAERARQTGVPRRTIYHRARQFDRRAMASLFGDEPGDRGRLPQTMRRAIAALKAEHPAFHLRDLATICSVRFGRRPSPHTVQRVLAEEPRPLVAARRFPPYAELADLIEARRAIVSLHAEGWSATQIAAYLRTSRDTVYATLRRWIEEQEAGLADRSHARHRRALKTDLRAIAAIKKLPHPLRGYPPELGEFRVHAALQQLGIELSPRTCGRILALNRRLYGLDKPSRSPREPQAMPFKANRRHEFWTVDVRYLDTPALGDGRVYAITVLENFSRAILASDVSRSQDLTAYLGVLYAAVGSRVSGYQHGGAEALVSDGGGIFQAKQALHIYQVLGIRKEQIDRRQAWQSSIETPFNVQRRMADWRFEQAATWAELRAAHDRFVADDNCQAHWAHRERQDGRQSPAAVLGWVGGTIWPPADLDRAFRSTRFGRLVDRAGYVRFRHWRVFGERGLARRRAALWLYGETLTVEFADEPLAQYRVAYQPDRAHFREVTEPRLFPTRHRSPQLAMWELGDGDWHQRPEGTRRLPDYAPRRRHSAGSTVQIRLFS